MVRCHHNARLRQRGGSPARERAEAATARNSRSRRARAATRARGSASWVSRSVHLEQEVSRLPQGIPECERDEILRDPRKYGLHDETVLRVPPRSLPTGGTVAFRRFSCGELHTQCYTSGQALAVLDPASLWTARGISGGLAGVMDGGKYNGVVSLLGG